MQNKNLTTSLKNISRVKLYQEYEKKHSTQAAENERQMGTVRREIKVHKYQFKYSKHDLNIHQLVLLYFTVHSSVTLGSHDSRHRLN